MPALRKPSVMGDRVDGCDHRDPDAGQEQGQPDDAVCAVQHLDGAQTTFEHGDAGMSAPANGQRAVNGAEIDPQTRPERLKLSSFEKSRATAQFTGCGADHP